MKKRNVLGFICIGIIVLIIIGSIFYSKNDKNNQESNAVIFQASKINNCKNTKVYAEMTDYQIISYCLDNIKKIIICIGGLFFCIKQISIF